MIVQVLGALAKIAQIYVYFVENIYICIVKKVKKFRRRSDVTAKDNDLPAH